MSANPTLVEGRNCDGCAMCCKMPEIKALSKPRDTWCVHCSTRTKCDNYEARPDPCRDFYCGWRREKGLGEEWRPIHARMMVNFTPDGEHLFIQVDPTRPDAWRKAPYHQQLRQLARINNPQGRQIIVSVGNRHIVIFPDRDEDIGTVAQDEAVTFVTEQTPTGPITRAVKRKIAPSA